MQSAKHYHSALVPLIFATLLPGAAAYAQSCPASTAATPTYATQTAGADPATTAYTPSAVNDSISTAQAASPTASTSAAPAASSATATASSSASSNGVSDSVDPTMSLVTDPNEIVPAAAMPEPDPIPGANWVPPAAPADPNAIDPETMDPQPPIDYSAPTDVATAPPTISVATPAAN